jgi:hypothetical protein
VVEGVDGGGFEGVVAEAARWGAEGCCVACFFAIVSLASSWVVHRKMCISGRKEKEPSVLLMEPTCSCQGLKFRRRSLSMAPQMTTTSRSATAPYLPTTPRVHYTSIAEQSTWYDPPSKNSPASLTRIIQAPVTTSGANEIPAYVLGALTSIGGTIGFARTGSVPSIAAGLTVGALVRALML